MFDEQLEHLDEFLIRNRTQGRVRESEVDLPPSWPAGSSLVLEEDTALELGNPRVGSASLLLWSDERRLVDGRISLVGPDLSEIEVRSIPLGQVIIVEGDFRDEYERYRDLKDAVYETRLKGFMVRSLPSRRVIWCRVNREALEGGFSLTRLGAALVRNLKRLGFVRAVEVVFVTSDRDDLEVLEAIGRDAGRIVEAMVKMNEEMDFDCERCEFQDICGSLEELRAIRSRLLDSGKGASE